MVASVSLEPSQFAAKYLALASIEDCRDEIFGSVVGCKLHRETRYRTRYFGLHRKQLVKLCRVEPRVEMSVREYEISYQGTK